MTTARYTDANFWPIFKGDLQQARMRVIIQSPYAKINRVKQFTNDLKTLHSRGIPVCIFLQELWILNDYSSLHEDNTAEVEEFQLVLKMLERAGAHINLKKDIHAKFAIIDDEILWEGSLNITSFNQSKEHMRRWVDRTEQQAIIESHGLAECSTCKKIVGKYMLGPKSAAPLMLGTMLAARRTQMNISQQELARLCGVSQQRIGKIETGANLTIDRLQNITDHLQMETMIIPSLYVPAVAKILQKLEESQN